VIVVSDTSPVLALAAIGQLDILRLLFADVVVPEAVHQELVRKNPEFLPLPTWLRFQRASNRGLVNSLVAEIDLAEAEAIALAMELHADLLLIDERLGREVAQRQGLQFIGLVGVLLEAKRSGYVSTVRPLLDDLFSKAGFRISLRLRRRVLELASEDET
jgi:hypothetical protein